MSANDFNVFLDELFFEGYANKLADESPSEYDAQLVQFLAIYGHEIEQ